MTRILPFFCNPKTSLASNFDWGRGVYTSRRTVVSCVSAPARLTSGGSATTCGASAKGAGAGASAAGSLGKPGGVYGDGVGERDAGEGFGREPDELSEDDEEPESEESESSAAAAAAPGAGASGMVSHRKESDDSLDMSGYVVVLSGREKTEPEGCINSSLREKKRKKRSVQPCTERNCTAAKGASIGIL